jgi:hypothetical protein
MMKKKSRQNLAERFPPSQPCSCQVCQSCCARPGWWTVEEAKKAIEAGLAGRMMLEMAPGFTFGVLSPAFKGCEVSFALECFSQRGCTFHQENNLCELHGTGLQPLECRYCHHNRRCQGVKCHEALGKDWDSPAGRALVVHWSKLTGFWARHVNQTNRRR